VPLERADHTSVPSCLKSVARTRVRVRKRHGGPPLLAHRVFEFECTSVGGEHEQLYLDVGTDVVV